MIVKRRNQMMRATLSFLTIAVIALPMTAQARNPSALEPNGELAVHGTVKGLKLRSQDAKAASKRLYKLYYKVELAASEAFKRKSDPTSIPFETLCKDIASLDQAAREAAHLQLMGEPAGTDLGVRIRALKQELHKLIWAARSTQRANRYRQKMIEKLKKAKPKNDSFLKKQEQAIKSGQLESAEVALEKFATKMAEDTQLLTPKEREPYVTYMLQLLDELERRLRGRGTEREEAIARRLEVASHELEAAVLYDHIVVNGTIEQTVDDVCELLIQASDTKIEKS